MHPQKRKDQDRMIEPHVLVYMCVCVYVCVCVCVCRSNRTHNREIEPLSRILNNPQRERARERERERESERERERIHTHIFTRTHARTHAHTHTRTEGARQRNSTPLTCHARQGASHRAHLRKSPHIYIW